MPVTARLNHKGDIAARGDCTVTGRRIQLARPTDETEEVSINFADWLTADGASDTVSARAIANNGTTVTEVSYGSSTWLVTITNEGYARLKVTTSDGRVWSGVLAMVEV